MNRIQIFDWEIMKSTKFHYLALMAKYISKVMDMMD